MLPSTLTLSTKDYESNYNNLTQNTDSKVRVVVPVPHTYTTTAEVLGKAIKGRQGS